MTAVLFALGSDAPGAVKKHAGVYGAVKALPWLAETKKPLAAMDASRGWAVLHFAALRKRQGMSYPAVPTIPTVTPHQEEMKRKEWKER